MRADKGRARTYLFVLGRAVRVQKKSLVALIDILHTHSAREALVADKERKRVREQLTYVGVFALVRAVSTVAPVNVRDGLEKTRRAERERRHQATRGVGNSRPSRELTCLVIVVSGSKRESMRGEEEQEGGR